jgi:hypothetical protein
VCPTREPRLTTKLIAQLIDRQREKALASDVGSVSTQQGEERMMVVCGSRSAPFGVCVDRFCTKLGEN